MAIKKLKHLRFGDCKRCGFCCTHKKCEHFEWKNGEATCKLYPDIPQECKDYPQVPPILIEECGYRFVDVKRRVKLEAREV